MTDYSGGGGFSSSSSGGFRDETRRGGFEEYNAGDDESSTPTRRTASVSHRAGSGVGGSNPTSPRHTTPAIPAPKPKEPEVDLLGGFGDEDVISTGIETNVFATDKALPALSVPPAVAATTD